MSLYAPDRHDIVIQNPDGKFVAVIEVKSYKDLTRDVATELRRNLMFHTLLPQTPYFLLMSQDKGFLWEEAWRKGPESPPTYEFPMDNVITRYRKSKQGEKPFGRELESLALRWLNDLAKAQILTNEEPEKTLALAGFTNSVKEGTVMVEVSE